MLGTAQKNVDRRVTRSNQQKSVDQHAPRRYSSGPFVRGLEEHPMEQILINLVTGALGGVGAGKASPAFDLGMVGNIISGLVGGGVLGQIVALLLPSVVAAAQSGNLSVGGVVSQVVAGGAGGAILTAIVGAIKNKVAA